MTHRPSARVPRLAPLAASILAAVLAVALAPPAAAAASDGGGSRATQDTGYAIVQLDAEPLATAARTKPPKGKKIDFSSSSVKSYRALLSKQRNDYKAWLRANVPQARVTGEFDISLNAVAVKLNVAGAKYAPPPGFVNDTVGGVLTTTVTGTAAETAVPPEVSVALAVSE